MLAQALLGMSIEKPWRLHDAYQLAHQGGHIEDLVPGGFRGESSSIWRVGDACLVRPALTGKSSSKEDKFRVASRAVARDYYMNIGTISDDFQVKIVNRANRRLGEVEEGFLASLRPDEAFTIGGRAVVLDRSASDDCSGSAGDRVSAYRHRGGWVLRCR